MVGRVVSCISCLLIGGTEMHTLALARALEKGGYRVTVCTYSESNPAMVAEIEAAGARLELLGLKWPYRLLKEPKRMCPRSLDSPLFLGCVLAQRLAWRFEGPVAARQERAVSR